MANDDGVLYDRACASLLVNAWFAPLPPVLHLFVSDDTPRGSDNPGADYTEASGPNYNPLPIGDGQLELVQPSPPLFAVVDAEFINIGPLTPGSDTIYGWWIDQPTTSSPIPLFGGRFTTPIVLNMAGQSVIFDEIALPLHACDTVPFFTGQIRDPWFQFPPVTGTPPLNFNYAPSGGAWTYNGTGTPGGSGVAGVGSGFGLIGPLPGLRQVAFLQSLASITQVFESPGGVYTLRVMCAQRQIGQPVIVHFEVDGNIVQTVSAPSTQWQAVDSTSFALTTGNHTIAFVGTQPSPATDATLFIQQVSLLPFPGP